MIHTINGQLPLRLPYWHVNRAAVAATEIPSGPTATVAAAILACESGGCGHGRDFIRTKTAQLRLDAVGCLNSIDAKDMFGHYKN